MKTNDETIIREGQNGKNVAAEQTTNSKNNAARWQTVSIGGVVGIAMGVGATRAIDAFASTESDNVAETEEVADGNQATATEEATAATEVHEATVSQGQSFGDAFAAARAEVGPGGVFMWHGRLYNTYTAEEWQAMSDAQKDEFADNVQPLLGQQTVETQSVVRQTVQHHEEEEVHVHISGNQVHVHLEEEQGQPRKTEVSVEEHEPPHEPEVHFLGVESREVEGQTVNVGLMSVDDVDVALVDLDNDREFDIRLMDENQNGELEDNEIEDISDRHLSVDTFQTLSEIQQRIDQDVNVDQVSNVQEDLAPDMPDYMNDANVDII